MIFISYSREDAKEVNGIYEKIIESIGEGHVFIDSVEIQKGEGWIEILNKYLAESDIFIPFISKSYLNSGICKKEFHGYFLESLNDSNKRIFPVYLEPELITKVPTFWKTINSIVNSKDFANDLISAIRGNEHVLKPYNAFSWEIVKYTDALGVNFKNIPINITNPIMGITLKEGSGLLTAFPSVDMYNHGLKMGIIGLAGVFGRNPLEKEFIGTIFKSSSLITLIAPYMKTNLDFHKHFLEEIDEVYIRDQTWEKFVKIKINEKRE